MTLGAGASQQNVPLGHVFFFVFLLLSFGFVTATAELADKEISPAVLGARARQAGG